MQAMKLWSEFDAHAKSAHERQRYSASQLSPRRPRLIVLGAAVWMVLLGYTDFRHGFGSFRMTSMTPIASLDAAIPLSGGLVALFTVEQLVNGWRHGFPAGEEESIEAVLVSYRFR